MQHIINFMFFYDFIKYKMKTVLNKVIPLTTWDHLSNKYHIAVKL